MRVRIIQGLNWLAIFMGILTALMTQFVVVSIITYFLYYYLNFRSWSPVAITTVLFVLGSLPTFMGGAVAAWRANARLVAHGVTVGLLSSAIEIFPAIVGTISSIKIQLGYFRGTRWGIGVIKTSLSEVIPIIVTSLFLSLLMGWLGAKTVVFLKKRKGQQDSRV